MPHDESQPQNDNPFAYHAAQGDSPDEMPRKKTPVTSEEANMFRVMALLMLIPLLLATLIMLLGVLHAGWLFVSDAELDNRVSFCLQYLFLTVAPWFITMIVTVGLFRAKHWAVNVGLIYSFLPTLLSVWFLLLFREIFAFLPLLGCIAYNILFIRAKCLLLANRRHAEEKEEETGFQV